MVKACLMALHFRSVNFETRNTEDNFPKLIKMFVNSKIANNKTVRTVHGKVIKDVYLRIS